MSQDRQVFKAILYLAVALMQGICLVTLPAASPILTSEEFNGLTENEYGFLFVAQIAAVIFFTFFMQLLLKKFKRRTIFIWGVIHNLSYLCCLMLSAYTVGHPITSFYLLFVASAFVGAGFGCLISLMNILIVELFPDHNDGALAALHGLLGTGAALSPQLVSFFHGQGQWVRSPMVSFGILLALCIVCILTKVITEPDVEIHFKSEKKKSLIPPMGVIFFLMIIVVYGVIESIMGNWTTVYMTSEKGTTLEIAAYGLSAFWGFLTVGRIITAVLSYKIDSRIFYRFSPLITILGLLLIVSMTKPFGLVSAYLVVGLGCSSFFPLSLSFAVRLYPDYKDAISSLGLAALMVGVGFGSFGMGMMRNAGILELSQFMNLACVCAAIMLAAAYPLTRSIRA